MNVSNRLNRHFAVAASAAVVVAGSASAAIQYRVMNLLVPFNVDGSYINVVTGAYSSAAADVPGWDINPYGTSTTGISLYAATGTGYMRNPGAGTSTSRTNLAGGTAIGSASFFYGSSNATLGTLVGQWALNSTGIFGFKFLNGATVNYGWARMTLGANTAARTIVDMAFEDSGAAIGAGVPAPGALALLGLAGLVGSRRRS
ncbi:MAG: hypothetical protein EXS00_03445 [Phycisphaerales bacterium]|nr:hypothetical protein [Phycisphaerales bacterium]